MSDSFEIDHRQINNSTHSEEKLIMATDMLNKLIADGYIVTPTSGYSQPTIPTAYRTVPRHYGLTCSCSSIMLGRITRSYSGRRNERTGHVRIYSLCRS